MDNKNIQSIFDKMHDILSSALGPDNRRQYMREKAIRGDINWSFALTPTDIIRNKIPANVIGCTGRAKLFCHLAGRCCLSWLGQLISSHGAVAPAVGHLYGANSALLVLADGVVEPVTFVTSHEPPDRRPKLKRPQGAFEFWLGQLDSNQY